MEQIDKLEEYEADYKKLVSDCRVLLEQAKKDRATTYWKIGEKILVFRDKYEVTGFMKTLHLDLGVPQRTLGYFLKFRQEYETFDRKIPWAYYIEFMNHLPKPYRREFEKRLGLGRIKNRDDLRSQIMSYRRDKGISL